MLVCKCLLWLSPSPCPCPWVHFGFQTSRREEIDVHVHLLIAMAAGAIYVFLFLHRLFPNLIVCSPTWSCCVDRSSWPALVQTRCTLGLGHSTMFICCSSSFNGLTSFVRSIHCHLCLCWCSMHSYAMYAVFSIPVHLPYSIFYVPCSELTFWVLVFLFHVPHSIFLCFVSIFSISCSISDTFSSLFHAPSTLSTIPRCYVSIWTVASTSRSISFYAVCSNSKILPLFWKIEIKK